MGKMGTSGLERQAAALSEQPIANELKCGSKRKEKAIKRSRVRIYREDKTKNIHILLQLQMLEKIHPRVSMPVNTPVMCAGRRVKGPGHA